MTQDTKSKNFSLLIIIIAFIAFVYIVTNAMMISDKRQIGTEGGIYTNKVTTSQEIRQKALALSVGCKSEYCKVQRILDYVTHIPYRINHFQANSPQRTIQNNFGDCDDKSNLLISMLHALQVESYFVLVPGHIFVIARLDDSRLRDTKSLLLNGKNYYILESTAKGSKIGFPLQYSLKQIEAVIDPFDNEKMEVLSLEYK